MAHAPQIDDCIELALVYNRDLFAEARVQAMLEQWIHLLGQIVDNPMQPLEQFSMVPPAAKTILPNPAERLDDRWQGPIHSWLARRAEEQPDKEAVADERDSWSYRDLDRLSNRLARRLIADGIKPKDVVAIYAHRDASLALALLGILKAGAVFVDSRSGVSAGAFGRLSSRGSAHARCCTWKKRGRCRTEIESDLVQLRFLYGLKLPRAKKQVARLLARCADVAPEVNTDGGRSRVYRFHVRLHRTAEGSSLPARADDLFSPVAKRDIRSA